MDPAVVSGIRQMTSGDSYLDIANIGKSVTDSIKPKSINYDIGPDGKEMIIEFSQEDQARLLKTSKLMSELQANAGSSSTQNPSGPTPQQPYMMGMGMMHSTYSSPESEEYTAMLEEDLGFKTEVVYNSLPDDYEDPNEPIRPRKEKFYIVVEQLMPDGTKQVFGDEESLEKYKEYEAELAAANSDFKDGATNQWATDSMYEVYNLATELRRYNEPLAEQLLWFQHESADISDFEAFKAKCIRKLMEYRSKDPLADVKSNPLITRNGRMFMSEPKDMNNKEFLEYRKQLADVLKEETQQEKEQKAIEKYVEDSDKRLSGLRKELNALTSHDNPKAAINELQLMTNICVCTTQEEFDRECRWQERWNSRWNPIQLNSLNQYKIYKKMMTCRKDEVPEGMTYDQWFDIWWNKPNEEFEKMYSPARIAAMKMQARFTNILYSQPTPEQLKESYDEETARRQRAFDQGMVDQNADFNQFFNGPYGANFIMHRTMESIRKRQQNSVRRLYDPDKFLDLLRQKDPKREAMFGPSPDFDTLVNSEEYQKRRKLFVESIYQKNELGTLHGGASHG